MTKYLVSFIGLYNASVFASPTYQLSLDSYSVSDAAGVYQYFDDMKGSIDYGDYAFTRNKLELSANWQQSSNWQHQLSIFYRYDYGLDFTPDAIEVSHKDKNKQNLTLNKDYDIEVSAKHFESRGLALGTQWQNDGIKLSVRLNVMEVTDMLVGNMQGGFNYSEDGLFGEVDLNQFYTNDTILEREISGPSGLGYSIDLAASWQINQHWSLAINLNDAVSHIRWHDLPFTEAVLQNSPITLDENGRLKVSPVISGIESEADYSNDFDPFKQYSVSYHFPMAKVSTKLIHYRGQDLVYLSANWLNIYGGTLLTQAGFSDNSLTLGFEKQAWHAQLALAEFDLKRSQSLTLSLGYKF